MLITVKVKLLGVFQGISGKKQLLIKLKKPVSIRAVVQELIELFSQKFKEMLIDPYLGDPRPNALIMVNGIEINVLEGLETELHEKDEVTIIPVSHGG
jgi:molybdopterin converting factor small subunit